MSESVGECSVGVNETLVRKSMQVDRRLDLCPIKTTNRIHGIQYLVPVSFGVNETWRLRSMAYLAYIRTSLYILGHWHSLRYTFSSRVHHNRAPRALLLCDTAFSDSCPLTRPPNRFIIMDSETLWPTASYGEILLNPAKIAHYYILADGSFNWNVTGLC